jgi:hypothetical protein
MQRFDWSSRLVRYHQEASRLRQEAEAAQDPETRAELLKQAKNYETLATAVERMDPSLASSI